MTSPTSDNPHASADAAIVVGIDGSDGAAAAVRWAVRAAAARGRRLRVVSCPPLLDPAPPTGNRAAASLVGLSPSAHLVVLGMTESAGAPAHPDSTLFAVVAQARGSVVVVRGTVRGSGPVVVGVDGSTAGEPALAAAFAEAALRGGDLVAVHAASDRPALRHTGAGGSRTPVEVSGPAERTLLTERLTGWSARYPDVRVRRDIVVCGPRERLGAWSRGAQLVVVGSHGRGGARPPALGSTGTWLVRHAACPVMITHPE